MTKKQLKALEHLPDVIEALASLAADTDRLQAAMAKAAGLGVLPHRQPPVRHAAPPPPVAMPPGQQDFDPSQGDPFMEAAPSGAAPDEPAYKKRQRAMLESIRRDPQRQEVLDKIRGTEEELAQ